jgi:hypothetical protein
MTDAARLKNGSGEDRELDADEIFVFGSNEAGRHGKGAALWARRNRGAVYGQARGLQGRSYGIPTKDRWLNTRPLDKIESDVRAFLVFAMQHPELKFYVTPIGCGLAGYRPEDIAPLFAECPGNVRLDPLLNFAAKEPRP